MLITRSNDGNAIHRSLLSASVIVLAGAAWLVLWKTGGSAHGSMHHHHAAMATSSAAPLFSMALFVASWTVMTIAMMLPTSLPVLTTFEVVARDRTDRALLMALVVAG